jgi:hypothetical protein
MHTKENTVSLIEVPTIILPKDPTHEFVKFMAHAEVDKRTEEYDERLAKLVSNGQDYDLAALQAKKDVTPYERIVGDYNAMVDSGIINILNALIGVGITAFSNANARLGVGDSSTAWATNQSDLQAASDKLRNSMNATYPLGTGTKTITFQSDFTTGQANWSWLEWGIFNAASGATSMLSRKAENLGTKASGTWTLTVTFAVA